MADEAVAISSAHAEEKSDLVFDIAACPVESVVVFLDRAEVCRTIDAKVKTGENEVVLRNVSSAADGDSIRVEGRGVATISEVSFQKKHVTVDTAMEKNQPPGAGEGSQQEAAKLTAELKQVQDRVEALKRELGRLTMQQSVLDSFGDQLVEQAGQEGVLSLGNAESIQGLNRYLELYEKRTEDLDGKRLDLQEELRIAEAKVNTLNTNIQERSQGIAGKKPDLTKMERQISILLDAEKDGDVHLVVYYVVLNASWSPKYDVRTFVNDKQMQVHYFGVIKQSTNEDWKDAHISLSTAVPSVGGTPPTISANTLSFVPRYHQYNLKSGSTFRKKAKTRSASFRRGRRSLAMRSDLNGSDSDGDNEMAKPNAEVQSGAFTTAFEIEKPATIPADNTGHKVQVAIMDFKPTFSYESVPKLSARAFLKASVKNESPYALLSGPSNIFLEGNFVAKSSLPAISPQEQFECSLGVDPSVRVTYKPVQRLREQGGLMSKTTTFKYRQFIEVKNTQQEQITVKIIDQLPLSTEEKIKVQLIAPELRKAERGRPLAPDAYPRLNPSNNIEWLLNIAAGQSEELQLRYSVDFPSGTRIDGL